MHSSIAPGPCLPSSEAAWLGWLRRALRGASSALALAGALVCLAGTLPPFLTQAQAQAQAQPLPSPLSPAWSDPRAASTALEQARRLYAEGQRDSAMKVVDTALQNAPRDAALRFTRAVMLADAGRFDEALQGFTELTQEFPELPEPHNNLATLYAARGELDQARTALDNAVRALPSYALAWENLGDVHLRIAERAWARAASLDTGSAAQGKLKLARELIDRVSPTGARPASVNLPGRRP
ncbi:MAG: tetratricopeptide repeat protein [Betaproteobacteria bacterium]|nr:tetratricopeptide repeat protein [Betaproteobacteria bacterium]